MPLFFMQTPWCTPTGGRPNAQGGASSLPEHAHDALLVPLCYATSLSLLFYFVLPSVTSQEPWFFTRYGDCLHPNSSTPWGCDQLAQQHYLLDTLHRDAVVGSGLTRAAFEASPDYILVSEKVMFMTGYFC